MEAKFKHEWDYLGWEKYNTAVSPYTQKDWNQTLITRINQSAAQIGKESYRGGGNNIFVHPKTFIILKDSEYFHINGSEASLAGRYKIKVDDSIPQDKLYVKHINKDLEHIRVKMNNPNLFYAIQIKTPKGELMGELSFKFIERNGDEEMTSDGFKIITEEMLTAEITILNHSVVDPITGELLIDYFTEIPEDIWSPSPRLEEMISDAMIFKSGPNDTPKMKFKIPVGKLPEAEQKSLLTKIKKILNIK